MLSRAERLALLEGLQAISLELRDDYAALRPDARHVEAPTGHYVHDEDPDLVVDEILRVLDFI